MVLAIVGAAFGARYSIRMSTMLLPGLVAPGVIVVRRLAGRPADARAGLRDWIPLVMVMCVFDNLENLTGVIRKVPIDDALYKIDLAIFGVEPTVWIGRLYAPLVTDWMTVAYGIFFILPMSLAIVLTLRGRRADFRELALSVMLQMWIGFFLFICFPAGPPRYYPILRDGPFRAPIPSLFHLNDALQATFDTYDPLLVRSAFPSLHCSYGAMTLVYAWRFGDAIFRSRKRLFFWLVLPLELSLFASTVYLRHHWIPDCLMGFLVATVACALAARLRRSWPVAIELTSEPATVDGLAR
jgi:membrane-associated phospholipid phosphatase